MKKRFIIIKFSLIFAKCVFFRLLLKVKGNELNKKVASDAMQRNDIALSPLAIPMLAGPGSMSLLIAMYQEHTEVAQKVATCLAILAVAFCIFLILKSAHYISRILGSSGIVAISRVIGFIVIAIGVQYIANGVVTIFKIV